MEEEDGLGLGIRSVPEVEEVAVGPQAADDGGAGRSREGEALEADGDGAVVADAHAGLLAPDVGPPRTFGGRAEHGAIFRESLGACGVRGGPEFAVDFMLVGVRQELVEQAVGAFQFQDAVGGQERGQALLPVVVAAFDLAFGLGRGGVAQGHAVEAERGPQLGEGVGGVGVEEGMVVHVERQGQAVGLENAGQEVQMGQERFAGVETGAGVVAGGVVQKVEQALFGRGAGEEGVRGGVVLPEGALIAGLPALDGFGGGFVTGVGSEFVFEGPAADAGAVRLEVEAAMEFAGGGAVGGGRSGGEEFGQECANLGGPVRMMVAAGSLGCPGVGVALGAGAQVVGAQLVETAGMKVQFEGRCLGREVSRADFGEEMADQRSGQTVDELLFFMARRVVERGIFRFATDAGRASRAALDGRPTCRVSGFRRRSGCVPAEPYPPLKHRHVRATLARWQQEAPPNHQYSNFDRTDLSSFDRTTTVFGTGVSVSDRARSKWDWRSNAPARRTLSVSPEDRDRGEIVIGCRFARRSSAPLAPDFSESGRHLCRA